MRHYKFHDDLPISVLERRINTISNALTALNGCNLSMEEIEAGEEPIHDESVRDTTAAYLCEYLREYNGLLEVEMGNGCDEKKKDIEKQWDRILEEQP